MELVQQAQDLFSAMGMDYSKGVEATLAFSTRSAPSSWKAIRFDTDSELALYHIITDESSLSSIRNFMSGVKKSYYVMIITLKHQNILFVRVTKQGSKNKPHAFILSDMNEYNKIKSIFRNCNIADDYLTTTASLHYIIENLAHSTTYYVNRGIFSDHYLNERMIPSLQKRNRNLKNESKQLFQTLKNAHKQKNARDICTKIFSALNYKDLSYAKKKMVLKIDKHNTAVAIITESETFDLKFGNVAPSIEAVAALDENDWVILTNGKTWRMYSSKISSASTNYFEINLEQINNDTDPRLTYFVAIFSYFSRKLKTSGQSDLDLIHEQGLQYAADLEQDMKNKIFDGDLFIKLVKGVLNYADDVEYSPEKLELSKQLSIKLLYRIMFIMYAEARDLLPTENETYNEMSLESVRDGLASFKRDPRSTTCWDKLRVLFDGISNGSPNANLPRYNGELFEFDRHLDGLSIRNEFLASVIQDMTEKDGKRIDYQNLGVRHLGSVYEGLLEYDVRQAKRNMLILDDGTFINADFAKNLKQKRKNQLSKNDIYLSSGGLAKKDTGSYFTPEPIVRYLVKEGLKPIFNQRESDFAQVIENYSHHTTKQTEQICNNTMLDLRILDPAMGSGHFLVVVADEITQWIMRLMQKYPNAPIIEMINVERQRIIDEQNRLNISLNENMLTTNTILKRMVIKKCIFGVDNNKLAAELAKLSLWLDSFTIGVPLTFFDHHIRHGNSLIGFGKTDTKIDLRLDEHFKTKTKSKTIISRISRRLDTTPSEIHDDRNDFTEFQQLTCIHRKQQDISCAHFIKGITKRGRKLTDNVALDVSKKHNTFHWGIEFPESFAEGAGFHLVIGNPPWEAVLPNDDEFFSRYQFEFRQLSSKADKDKIKHELLRDPEIKAAFDDYVGHIKEQCSFYSGSGQYSMRGRGHTDMWKLFLERMLSVMSPGGVLSVVLPSGILTNEGATDLRKYVLGMEIIAMYEFENQKAIFNIHRSYKFVMLVIRKSEPKMTFPAAFYLHDILALKNKTERNKMLKIPVKMIHDVSPDTLAIPEFRSPEDVDTMAAIYASNGRVGDGLDNGRYTIELTSELNRTFDSDLFRRDGRGWPLIEGKNFHQFIYNYSTPKFTILEKLGLRRLDKIKQYRQKNYQIHQLPRLTYRQVASATNMRTMISCIMPPGCFFSNKCQLVILQSLDNLVLDHIYYDCILYLAAIFNSFTFDYILRAQVNTSLNFFIIKNIAIPNDISSTIAQKIIKLSATLSAQNKLFPLFNKQYNLKTKLLTISDRIKLTSELDALVAHHYKITRSQYVHILSSFTFKNYVLDLSDNNNDWPIHKLHAFQNKIKENALSFYDRV